MLPCRRSLALFAFALLVVLSWLWLQPAMPCRASRTSLRRGVRENQLVGYGLVVGLNGTWRHAEQLALTPASPRRRCSSASASTRAAPTCGRPTWPPSSSRPTSRPSRRRARASTSPCLVAGRREVAAGRHAAGDPAARRRRRGLCRRAGLRDDFRLLPPAARPPPSPRRADRRPQSQRRADRARDRVPAQSAARPAPGAAESGLPPPRAAWPPPSTTSSATRPPSRPIPRRSRVQIPRNYKGNMIQLLTENRAAARRARPARPDRHRRALRHHRHGPRRARLQRSRGAGQSTVTISEQPVVSQPNPLSQGQTVVVPRTG